MAKEKSGFFAAIFGALFGPASYSARRYEIQREVEEEALRRKGLSPMTPFEPPAAGQGGEMWDDAGKRYQAEKEGIEAALAFCYPGRPASELAATAHKIQSDMHAVALRALLARESAEPAEECIEITDGECPVCGRSHIGEPAEGRGPEEMIEARVWKNGEWSLEGAASREAWKIDPRESFFLVPVISRAEVEARIKEAPEASQ